MIAIDCACGHHMEASNEDDLVREVRKHVDLIHSDQRYSDQQILTLVADKKYTQSGHKERAARSE